MSRDGNGQYSLPTGNPVTPGTIIESEWANVTMADLGAALSASIAYDGQTVPVNNLPMGNYRHTGVSDPSSRNQYLSLGMSQDGRDTRVTILSGTNDLIGSLVGGMSSYAPGQVLTFQALTTNTGPVTLNINSIGARDVILPTGDALVAGQIGLGKFYQVFYTGTEFQVLNASILTGLGAKIDQNSISGWDRPASGVYPPLVIASPTSITVPAGTGTIVPPGNVDAASVVEVSWLEQTVELDYITSAFRTTLAIDTNGAVVQIPDQVNSAVYRAYIVVGVAGHVGNTLDYVTTTPALYGDDGYLNRDVSRLFNGMLITGGEVTQSGANPLAMNVNEGIIFYAGGDPTQPDSPNFKEFASFINIQFYTLAGPDTVGGPTNLAPVTQYDPNFGGVLATLPNPASTVVHRLYWNAGTFIWEFGQRVYSSLANGVASLAYERSMFKTSRHLAGATMICEIIAQRNCAALSDAATCVIVPRGGFEFVIGTVGGLDEAPQDGTPYGRQDATWVSVLGAGNPSVTGNLQITKADPRVIFKDSPAGALWSGLSYVRADDTQRLAVKLNPDDSLTITTHNAGGTLVSTTTITNSGGWTFPGSVIAKTLSVNTGSILAGVGDVDLILQATLGDNVVISPDNGSVDYNFTTTGLDIPAAPTLPEHATNKLYVDSRPQSLQAALGNETAVASSGVKLTFRSDYSRTLTGLKASLNVAQTAGALFTIDVKVGGVSILSTLLTFDNGSKTTVGAATPVVIATPAIAADAEITVEITQVGDNTAIGPKITFLWY